MKLANIILPILVTLLFSTIINAGNDRCINAYGNVYGEKDFYGQSYEDFLKEQKSRKMSLEFLVKYCKGTKYEAEKESFESVSKNLEKTTKLSESDWKKEYKYP